MKTKKTIILKRTPSEIFQLTPIRSHRVNEEGLLLSNDMFTNTLKIVNSYAKYEALKVGYTKYPSLSITVKPNLQQDTL